MLRESSSTSLYVASRTSFPQTTSRQMSVYTSTKVALRAIPCFYRAYLDTCFTGHQCVKYVIYRWRLPYREFQIPLYSTLEVVLRTSYVTICKSLASPAHLQRGSLYGLHNVQTSRAKLMKFVAQCNRGFLIVCVSAGNIDERTEHSCHAAGRPCCSFLQPTTDVCSMKVNL